jgi:hypothetical protein
VGLEPQNQRRATFGAVIREVDERSGIAPEVLERFMGTILLIILVLLLVGALPTWPYSTGWGYYPSGGVGLIVLVLLVLLLMGRL